MTKEQLEQQGKLLATKFVDSLTELERIVYDPRNIGIQREDLDPLIYEEVLGGVIVKERPIEEAIQSLHLNAEERLQLEFGFKDEVRRIYDADHGPESEHRRKFQ